MRPGARRVSGKNLRAGATLENADVELFKQIPAGAIQGVEIPRSGTGQPHFDPFHQGVRTQDQQRKRTVFHQAVKPVPGGGGNGTQLLRRKVLQVQRKQLAVAVAQQKIGGVQCLFEGAATHPQQARHAGSGPFCRFERIRRIYQRADALGGLCQNALQEQRPIR